MKTPSILMIFVVLAAACAPASTTALPATALPTSTASPATSTPSDTPLPPTGTPLPSSTPSETSSPLPTETFTPTPTAAATETIGEMLKTHIVFYLILPEKGRTDACGNMSVEPIISKRLRTGDKFQDVQIALNMLFSVGSQFYGAYYNALWNTDLEIASFKYLKEIDEVQIDFTGFLPLSQISACDKHAIREQIWTTFFHYEFHQKVFTYNGKFLIDQLGRK